MDASERADAPAEAESKPKGGRDGGCLIDGDVTAQLADSIQSGLVILGGESGLPELPHFGINLHLPAAGGSEIAHELARHIRQEFGARFGVFKAAA